MTTRRQRGSARPTTIPIYTLSGGVGRQAPSKRLPSESQELINALCSVERSIEKRPGTDLMGIRLDTTDYSGEALGLDPTGVYEFFWHALADDARFLIIIDRSATGTAQGDKNLYYVYYYNEAADYFEDNTPTNQHTINTDTRAYLTYGGTLPLKMVARGENLVFLNPAVVAGYTSLKKTVQVGEFLNGSAVTGSAVEAWLTVGLDGQIKGTGVDAANTYTSDLIGAKEKYLTALNVDPAGIAVFWDTYTGYAQGTEVLVIPGTATIDNHGSGSSNGIYEAEVAAAPGTTPSVTAYYYILQAQDVIIADHPVSHKQDWVVIATNNPSWIPGSHPVLDSVRSPLRIEVKDWVYPNSTTPQLGQSLPTFADLRLPPLAADVTDGNNNAEQMFVDYYGLVTGGVTHNSADGKVYFIQGGYQGQAPGYYLAKDVDPVPHMLKVRTPDEYSVLDAKRLPVELEFTGITNGVANWNWDLITWAPRTSGNKDTNPGPTPFKDGRQAQLSTIAFFRNRLWLSSGDVVFSSRESDFTDWWIEDPGLIIDRDVIDIAASTNTFTPITSMVPFKEYMFVNTNADTQYELLGSENQITPFTAELQPMTFYSTAPLVDPLTLGNNIFFYDAERLYLYLGRGGTLSTAAELSSHCPKYLPRTFGATTVAAAQDSILAVDGANLSDIYVYTTRYRGEQIVQNAFYKFNYEGSSVKSMRAWDNHVYMVMQRNNKFYIERQLMRFDDALIPRLDRKQNVTIKLGSTLSTVDTKFDPTAVNAVQDVANYTTTIRIPMVIQDDLTDYMLVDTAGLVYTIESATVGGTGNLYTDLVVNGLVTSGSYWVGKTFTMTIQLSTQFMRGEDNNPAEGVLNLAALTTRHFQTGDYDVLVQRRGRPLADVLTGYKARDTALSTFMSSFTAPRSNTYDESNLSINNIEDQGDLVSKILGFSDKTDIYIMSDYFTPVNITNMQLRGKFKQTYSSLV